jgi:GGDEF domain-containing protein
VASIERAFVLGGASDWSARLADTLGIDCGAGMPERAARGDLLVLDASSAAGAAAMPLGNAFSTCRALKRDPAVLVFVAVSEADPYGAEIARYCMADGVLPVGAAGELLGLDRIVERIAPRRGPAPIDSLLEKLEGDLASQEERVSGGLQKILAESDSPGSIARWTDPDTGLFDGPFAGFKLDEELKRARRFHQPLSLVLLDAGIARWPADLDERRTVLAEVASIFLNECRDIDVLARFTDTVFLFLFPGTGPDGASVAATRIVDALLARDFSVPIAIDPAAGIATVPQAGIRDRRAFLARAEAALERARSEPGCRVRSAEA